MCGCGSLDGDRKGVCVCVCARARAHPCYAPRFDGDVSVSNSPLLN